MRQQKGRGVIYGKRVKEIKLNTHKHTVTMILQTFCAFLKSHASEVRSTTLQS